MVLGGLSDWLKRGRDLLPLRSLETMICEVFDEGVEVGRRGRGCAARGEELCCTGRRNIVPAVSQMSPNSSDAGMFG